MKNYTKLLGQNLFLSTDLAHTGGDLLSWWTTDVTASGVVHIETTSKITGVASLEHLPMQSTYRLMCSFIIAQLDQARLREAAESLLSIYVGENYDPMQAVSLPARREVGTYPVHGVDVVAKPQLSIYTD